jgi:hypothetical protein
MADKEKGRKPEASKRQKSSTEKIFGEGVMAHGYTGLPNILVRGQARLGLNPVQFNILVQLLSYWIDPHRPPYPPKRYLRQRMGISESTLKKHIRELEQAGFIERVQQTTAAGDFGSNIYRMDGLVNKLTKLVPHFDQEREEREESRRKTETPRSRSGIEVIDASPRK